jgi:hypothetical protein
VQEPIEYQLLTHLRDALAAITIGEGYHYDVRGTAVKLDPNHDVDDLIGVEGGPPPPRPFVLIELTSDAWTHMPSMRARIEVRATIHWVHDSDPTRDADRIQTYLRGCADVERAILVDLTRGGLATDTRILRRTFETSVDSSLVWGAIEIVMPTIRTFGEPNVTV